MVIAEATEDETLAVINTDLEPEFTFDKHDKCRLGLVQVPGECKKSAQN